MITAAVARQVKDFVNDPSINIDKVFRISIDIMQLIVEKASSGVSELTYMADGDEEDVTRLFEYFEELGYCIEINHSSDISAPNIKIDISW